jgi:hypothetical protein
VSLSKTIHDVATKFAQEIPAAVRHASLADLADSTSTVRIKRRDGSIVHVGNDVLALTGLLSARPNLRAEEIRATLLCTKTQTTKAITKALEGRISKQGQKRGSHYRLR